MNVIMEYQFPGGSIDPVYKARMPKRSKIVHVGVKDDFFTFWAIVDTENEEETRNFHIVGSYNPKSLNHEIKKYWVYLGTFIFDNGQVFHLFEDEK